MKSFVFLFCLVIASATTYRDLNDIPNVMTRVTVAAQYPDDGVAPTLTSFTYPTTLDSSASPPVAFVVTGAATNPGNYSITSAQITLTSGSDTRVMSAIPTVSSIGNTVWTAVSCGYPKLLVDGNYAVSVTLWTSTFASFSVSLASGSFPPVDVTPYVPLTVTAYQLVSPQTGGCDSSGCPNKINGSATLSADRNSVQIRTYLRATTAATGVRFATSATTTNGMSDFNVATYERMYIVLGGFINGEFVNAQILVNTETLVPQDNSMAIATQILENNAKYTYYSETVMSALQSSVQLTSGTDDITAPICNVLSVSNSSVSTNDAPVPVSISLSCNDVDSGLWIQGYIYQIQIASGAGGSLVSYATFDGPTSDISIVPYVSGTFEIVGVFAIDKAGNAVLYGTCNGVVGLDTLGCTGSSTSSSVSFSFWTLVLLALFALTKQ